MSTALSATLALLGSLGMPAAEADALPTAHGSALTALRTAQVDLYCDRDAAAMTALREARRALAGNVPLETAALASVDVAAWHIRRHEMHAAQAALAQARRLLA